MTASMNSKRIILIIAALALLGIGATCGLLGCGGGSGSLNLDHAPQPSISGLPPDPGEAGKTTLEGIDSDKDGVRDDVQRYIAITYPKSAKTRAALTQAAKSLQMVVLDARGDQEVVAADVKTTVNMIACLEYILPSDNYTAIYHALRDDYVLNTPERKAAFMLFNRRLAGSMIGGPKGDGKAQCDFNPDTMED